MRGYYQADITIWNMPYSDGITGSVCAELEIHIEDDFELDTMVDHMLKSEGICEGCQKMSIKYCQNWRKKNAKCSYKILNAK